MNLGSESILPSLKSLSTIVLALKAFAQVPVGTNTKSPSFKYPSNLRDPPLQNF